MLVIKGKRVPLLENDGHEENSSLTPYYNSAERKRVTYEPH